MVLEACSCWGTPMFSTVSIRSLNPPVVGGRHPTNVCTLVRWCFESLFTTMGMVQTTPNYVVAIGLLCQLVQSSRADERSGDKPQFYGILPDSVCAPYSNNTSGKSSTHTFREKRYARHSKPRSPLST